MYHLNSLNPRPYGRNKPYHYDDRRYQRNNDDRCNDHENMLMNHSDASDIKLIDYGNQPFIININTATLQNKTFRTALWTGEHLQLTLTCIPVGGDIGLEVHPNVDQFLRIEEGHGIVKMGRRRNRLNFQKRVCDDFIIIIPAGTWHNLINTGNTPMKLYSIYAPPQHPFGTVHPTKADAEAAENNHDQCE